MGSGGGADWTHRLGAWLLSYELYAVNGLTSAISEANGLRLARGSVLQGQQRRWALTGRVSAYFSHRGRFVPTVEVGLSGYTGEYNRSGKRANLLAVDLLARNAYPELAGEYARAFIDGGLRRRLHRQHPCGGTDGDAGRLCRAARSLAAAPVLPALAGAAAVAGRGLAALALRYEEVDTHLDVRSQYDQRRLSLGLNLLSAAFVFKHELQWTVNDADGTRPSSGSRRRWALCLQ